MHQRSHEHGAGYDGHSDGHLSVRPQVVQEGAHFLFTGRKYERGDPMKARSGDGEGLRWLLDQDGQALPWMALLLVVLTGMGGLSTDLGRAYIAQRQLQASTDAAAMAGAYAMAQSTATASSVQAAVTNFSSAKGGANVSSALPNAQLVSTT